MGTLQSSSNFDQQVDQFITQPQSFKLFRGERKGANEGGLHFTTDLNWAHKFGDAILEGALPRGSNVKLISQVDLDEAIDLGITSDRIFHAILLEKGYDALVGYDNMNSQMLDVIVHPRHLHRFKQQLEPPATP